MRHYSSKITTKTNSSTNTVNQKNLQQQARNPHETLHKKNSQSSQNKTLHQQSTQDSLSLISSTSQIQKIQSFDSISTNDNEIQKEKNQEHLCINKYLGKNQMYIIFQFCSFQFLFSVRRTCKSWKLLIDNFIAEQTPLYINERNQLQKLLDSQMESESSHSIYVRAYKKVSLGHDLIFNLGQNDAEQFYLLKDKSEYIKEIRSITHQIIGVIVIEKNKQIKKYSVQYYLALISACKEVETSKIEKEIILRMKNIARYEKEISDEQLSKISKFAYALKVLISGYLHLYIEMNPLQSQKVRLEKLKDDINLMRKFNKNKSSSHKVA